MNDLRFAFRALRKNPGYAAAAVLSLALGIGVASGIFRIVNAILFRPLPVPEPDRLVAIYNRTQRGRSSNSWPDYLDRRARGDLFAGLMAYARLPVRARLGGQSARLSSELVSTDYFAVLGVRPLIGRAFLASEDRSPVAVLSHAL